jgi:hypothetical protein
MGAVDRSMYLQVLFNAGVPSCHLSEIDQQMPKDVL